MSSTNNRHVEVLVLLTVDLLSIAVCMATALFFRGFVLPMISPTPLSELTPESIAYMLLSLVVWVFFLAYEGLYSKRFSFWDEVKALWKVIFLASIAAFVIVSVGKLSHIASRSAIIATGTLSLIILPFARTRAQSAFRRFGLFTRRVLIVGAGDVGKSCLSALRREKNYGYEVVGFVDDDPTVLKTIDGIRVHRGIDRVERYTRPCRVTDVFIAMPELGKQRIEELINRIQLKVERILFVPDVHSIPVIGTEIHHFFADQIFSVEIKNNLSQTYNILIKRLFDILVSSALLLAGSLPMVVLAVLVAWESPGSPFFTQNRIGRGGRPFRVYKFRTMFQDGELKLQDLLARDENARRSWESHWKLKNDPRVTRIGTFLRRTSLDELPQLLNVLRGQMSLVGPRPYLPSEIDTVPQEERVFLGVPPGITGLWQVSGRSDTAHDYRIALDVWYVRNWSLWLDIVILIKTVKVVLQGGGAY